jgi:hypothetical protein
MQRKIPLKWSLPIVSIVRIALCSIIIFSLNLGLLDQGSYMNPVSSASSQAPQNLTAGTPVKSIQRTTLPAQTNSVLTIRLKIP